MISPELFAFFMPLGRVRGVGPKTVEAFKRLGLENIRDLLLYSPSSLIDRSKIVDLRAVLSGQIVTQVMVVDKIVSPQPRSKAPTRVICSHDGFIINLLYFNAKALNTAIIKVGASIAISGEVSNVVNRGYNDKVIEIAHPDLVKPAEFLKELATVEPVYPSTYGTTSRYIHNAIKNALVHLPALNEWLSDEIVREFSLPSFKESILALHNPKSELDLFANALPRVRLAYDEMLAHELRLKLLRKTKVKVQRKPFGFVGELKNKLLANLAFELTNDQQQAIAAIENMQKSSNRAGVILQGDVGAGKTIVAIMAMLNVIEAGKKAVIMVPTELLALQHFKSISKSLDGLDINVRLLISNLKSKEKSVVLQELESSNPMIVVGTHALFQETVKIKDLGIIIVDEQHRFGVEQRNRLLEKNKEADFLMMSATPIPRTLAMTINGDLDIICIDNKPANRKDIITSILNDNKINQLIDGIKRALLRGEKVYWVCPLIEESEALDLGHIQERYSYLHAIFGERVGVVHGKQSFDERDATMKKFAEGEVSILLATSVIEVGVDVKEATLIVIENAERFGLAQLHQLRGRVGRNDLQSYCVLLYKGRLNEKASLRLRALRDSNDGFYISRQDLRIRGAGDVLGLRQSGVPDFKFFSYEEHEFLLSSIDDYTDQLVESDLGKNLPVRNLLDIFGVGSVGLGI